VNPRREPTPAPPRETWNQNSRNRTFDDDTKPANSDEIVIPLTDDGADTSHPGRQEETSREPSLVPVAPSPTSSETQSTTARKPAEWSSVASVDPSRQTVSETPRNSVIGSLLYPGLVGVAPATRAKQLSIALGADRALPETAGKPIGLVECLQHAHGDRRTAVESYWRLRQRTAEHQQFAQQAEWIDSLKAATLEHRGQPAGPVDMLRLHAVALATKAVLYETNIRMLEAQSDLAGRTGAAMASTWPLAATPPHAGKYLLNLESQPRNLATSWSIRRLATRIPSLGDSVAQHAAAVVEADAARADAIAQYSASAASIEPVLENIRRQTDQTDAFLTAITEYNLAIADYALAIMPSDTPADKLAAALVVKP
jgi:hypothetical protein